jgi:hypothetical protein
MSSIQALSALNAETVIYRRLSLSGTSHLLCRRTLAASAMQRPKQSSLTETSQRTLCRQHQISMDRVIVNRFDPPYMPIAHEPVANHTLPISFLSDVLSMDEADFVTQ